jgi:uncharacterized protein (UPF0332 family)
MLKNIYKKLGIEGDLLSSEKIFINKIVNQIYFLQAFKYGNENIFNSITLGVCNEIGLPYKWDNRKIDGIVKNELTLTELIIRLQVLVNFSYSNKYINNLDNTPNRYSILTSIIKKAFEESVIDLGFALREYKNKPALIYKRGVGLLDEKVVLDVLDWLENYPKAKENYSAALKLFLQKDYANSITNSYSALEAVAKQILNTKAALDNDKTRNLLIKKLNLDDEWGKILLHFSRISHEFSTRHGGNNSLNCTEEQAEFYLYQTGTYLRLISKIEN